MELLAITVAVAGGLEIRRTLILVGVVLAPLATLAGLAVVYWRQSRVVEGRAPLFCEGVASELRSGSALGHALVNAAGSLDEPALGTLDVAMAPAEAASIVGQAFPDVGRELEATIAASSSGGSQSADLFDEIGSLAIAQAEVSREVRVASAPARATAAVFIGAPLVFLTLQVRSGRLAPMLAHSEQRVVALVGLFLFVMGLLSASALAWRSR